MREVSVNLLDLVVKSVLEELRVPANHSQIVSDTILFAHQSGKGTHGITRLPIYVKKIKNGSLNTTSCFEFIKDRGVVSLMDADHGFGQVAAQIAIEKALEKAELFGLGAVGVRNSNNFGTVAYFLHKVIE